MIKLKIRKIEKNIDERGYLVELLRKDDVDGGNFGQLILTTANHGFTKGKHYHMRKREWYMVIGGEGQLLVRNRKTGEEVKKKLSKENLELVEIPLGFYHEIENTGKSEMVLLAYTDEQFDPADPDTFYES